MVIIPREETLEELDARLEREENERIAAGKQQQVEALRQREPVVEASGGVNYKGQCSHALTESHQVVRSDFLVSQDAEG